MRVRFGTQTMDFPTPQFGELRDSNNLLGDPQALRDRMAEDGYLLLRGLIPREKVETARATILAHMAEKQALEPGTPVLEGVMAKGKTVGMMGRKGITHHEDVLEVLESPELFTLYERFLGQPTITYDYKWLRGVGNEEYTGAHMDVVYMGRGTVDHLYTCWIPFGDIPVEQGTLAMCVGSHNGDGFAKVRATYGRMDVDRDRIDGWFSDDPLEIVSKFGGRWATTDFRMGDVITFGMHTMHASTTNTTKNFRLSCDVRFQPASAPVDDRWTGVQPKGHYGWHSEPEKNKPMTEARAEWGI